MARYQWHPACDMSSLWPGRCCCTTRLSGGRARRSLVSQIRQHWVMPRKLQVLLHYEAFRREGARVTYKEFDFGHLDFTFAVRSTAASASISV